MREILFRGQLRRKGEKVNMAGEPLPSIWKYGGVSQYGGGAMIYQAEPKIEKFPVYGDTVGQYTGLRDKNGERIFEGDIIEYNGTKHRVVFENRFQTAYFGIVMSAMETWGFSNSAPANMMEVIGNIHDNPELLEGEHNG